MIILVLFTSYHGTAGSKYGSTESTIITTIIKNLYNLIVKNTKEDIYGGYTILWAVSLQFPLYVILVGHEMEY